MSRLKDLVGQRFTRLTVIKRAEDRIKANGARKVYWRCICDCGNVVEVRGDKLKAHKTKSCGCYGRESPIIHGQSNTKLYRLWSYLKGRNLLCDEWANYEVFYNDVKSLYREGFTVNNLFKEDKYTRQNIRFISWEDRKKETKEYRKTNKYNKNQKKSREAKRRDKQRYRIKYPYKEKAGRACSNLPRAHGYHLHHWNYNEEFWTDVIEVTPAQHVKLHQLLVYDEGLRIYRDLNGKMLDSKESHIQLLNKIKEEEAL